MVVDQGVTLIYDIACQYSVYLYDRIGDLLPAGLQIDRGIDMFHVHGHKDKYFFRFTPSFIPGAAVTSDKILEHLWSGLNSVMQAARTTTLANRAEILENHASDSNFKKALSMAKYLCGQHTKATIMQEEVTQYFHNLSSNVTSYLIKSWTTEITRAESECYADVKVMDVYVPVGQRSAGGTSTSTAASALTLHWSGSKVFACLEFALIVEEHQYVPQ